MANFQRLATNATKRAGKLAARTPAGIYAKALGVRFSSSGAVVLAMSLADDFYRQCRIARGALSR